MAVISHKLQAFIAVAIVALHFQINKYHKIINFIIRAMFSICL
jgi:hypothetical protein